ncbi:MAG: DNA polymerase III subunit beta [Patescibacteria group bacterium]
MKFTCTQENLNRGLNMVSHVASKNVTLPILNNILIKAQSGRIELMATNLEIGITCAIRGKIDEDGSYTIPARLLHDYINLLPAENISIELAESGIRVGSTDSETLIKGASAEEFPLIPQIEKKSSIRCSAKDLRLSLGQVVFAAATDEMRPEISGVFFTVKGNDMILAATDSYRLAEKKMKCRNDNKEEIAIIVPLHTLHELTRIISEDQAEVEIFMGENQILFVYDDIEFVSRLVEGQYPDYKQIIPKTSDIKADASVVELTNAVKAASLFCKPGINDVSLGFKVKDKHIEVMSSNNQSGENRSKVSATLSGKDGSIVFNYRYLLDGLAALNNENIILEITTSTNPGSIKPAQDKDYVYIIMPIRQ